LKKIIFLLAGVLLLLSGCGAEKKVVVAKPRMIPAWYSNPPQSNEKELYALGEGKNQKEAIANALSFMASTLSVSISSSFDASTTVREGSINSADSVYKSNTTSRVKEIRISSYRVLQSKSLGFKRYAVLVKSNKRELFLSMKKEIEQNFFIIEQAEKKLKNVDAITRLAFYREKKKSLQTLPDTLIVMNVLNPEFYGDDFIRKTQEISSSYQDIIQNISFSISSNGAASNLKSPLSKGISAKHLKIKKSRGKMHFNIYVSSNIVKANSYGFTLARSEISIVTKDYRGTVVGSNAINLVGQSSQGYEIAKQNISYRLNAKIEEEGIARVLGLDI